MKIKNLLLAWALLGAYSPAKAIPNYVAGGLTVTTTVWGMMEGLGFTHAAFRNNPLGNWIGFATGGLMGGWFGSWFFYQFTPEGRMKRARAIVECLQCKLASQDVRNVGQCILPVKEMYSEQLDNAYGLAMAAEQEDMLFTKKAYELYAQIDQLKTRLSTMCNTSKAVQTI